MNQKNFAIAYIPVPKPKKPTKSEELRALKKAGKLKCKICENPLPTGESKSLNICPECYRIGWRRCSRCGKLFITPDGLKFCLDHPSRRQRTNTYIPPEPKLKPTEITVTKFTILNRDMFRCIYCGESNLNKDTKAHLDHVIPWSKGGKTRAWNIVTSCEACNHSKSDRNLSQEVVDELLKIVHGRNVECGISDDAIVEMSGKYKYY